MTWWDGVPAGLPGRRGARGFGSPGTRPRCPAARCRPARTPGRALPSGVPWARAGAVKVKGRSEAPGARGAGGERRGLGARVSRAHPLAARSGVRECRRSTPRCPVLPGVLPARVPSSHPVTSTARLTLGLARACRRRPARPRSARQPGFPTRACRRNRWRRGKGRRRPADASSRARGLSRPSGAPNRRADPSLTSPASLTCPGSPAAAILLPPHGGGRPARTRRDGACCPCAPERSVPVRDLCGRRGARRRRRFPGRAVEGRRTAGTRTAPPVVRLPDPGDRIDS